MTDTSLFLSFFYAPYCSRQFIVMEGGFLLFRPLTAHLYVAPSMANLRSPLRTHRLPKQAIPTFSSQSLHSNDVVIQHAAMQLQHVGCIEKGHESEFMPCSFMC